MKEVQLLYVINEVSSNRVHARQELVFFVLLENLAFAKAVDILWAGEDGAWQALPAEFHSATGSNKEYWKAAATFSSAPHRPRLPGNIVFAVRYRAAGQEFWDNNSGVNYRSNANAGIQVAGEHLVQNVEFAHQLEDGRQLVPVTVATSPSLRAKKVTVHWTTDNWQRVHTTRCYQKRGRSPHRHQHAGRHLPQVWKGLLNIGNAFRLQYSICCESDGRVVWDNNFGGNYSAAHRPLKVLILNLHCYQEDNQDHKLSQIARAIDELGVDVVCLQEVAEPWNDGRGDFEYNAARIINDRLASPYHLCTDWSHLGFDKYREGVAVLSRYPVVQHEARYVSGSQDPYSIHARKVVRAQVAIPTIGTVNFYSSHLSWWEDGFAEQFGNLRAWANDRHGEPVNATLLCGDFNIKAGSRGYQQVVETSEYEDQFLAANAAPTFEKIFRNRRAQWQRYLADDHRIDYIFMRKASQLRVTSGIELFTDRDYGRVSDHPGYLMTFEPL